MSTCRNLITFPACIEDSKVSVVLELQLQSCSKSQMTVKALNISIFTTGEYHKSGGVPCIVAVFLRSPWTAAANSIGENQGFKTRCKQLVSRITERNVAVPLGNAFMWPNSELLPESMFTVPHQAGFYSSAEASAVAMVCTSFLQPAFSFRGKLSGWILIVEDEHVY